jgi:cell division protein FtsB
VRLGKTAICEDYMRVFKKRKIGLKFKLIVLACFLVYMGIAIYTQQMNIGYLQNEKDDLNQQYEQAEADLSRLQSKSDFMYTDKYAEDAARDKFGLTYNGEIILEPKQ